MAILVLSRWMKLDRRRMKPVGQQMKPVQMILVFYSFFFLLSQMFSFCVHQEFYQQNQCKKYAFSEYIFWFTELYCPFKG